MEENITGRSNMPTAARYGFFGGLISIFIGVLVYVFDFNERHWTIQVLSAIIFIILIIIAIQHQRDKVLGGYIKYGHALGTGMLTSLVMGVIIIAYMYIFMYFIEPAYRDELFKNIAEAMTKQGKTAEQIEKAKMTVPFLPMIFLFQMMFGGLIISLIASLFLKKVNPMEGVVREEEIK